MKRRNRSSLYSIVSSPFTLIAAVVMFVVFARAAWSIHGKASESAARLEIAQTELARLEANRADLATRVDQLSTPAGVKAQIRERYHAVEPGESVAVIVDGSSTTTNTAATGNATGSESLWQRFLNLFR